MQNKQSTLAFWMAVAVNVFLNLLVLWVICDAELSLVVFDPDHDLSFGFDDLPSRFRSLIIIFLMGYSSMIFMYMVVIFRILLMFKIAYPEMYQTIRNRMVFFLGLYVTFMIVRVVNYQHRMLHWRFSKEGDRTSEILYYTSETILIIIVLFVMYTNSQTPDDEDPSPLNS
jgi:hypothetical protein